MFETKINKKEELYISIDIEADGPIPGEYSMLSLGAAAFTRSLTYDFRTFEVNLETLEGAREDFYTMKWWDTQPREIWDYARKDKVHPQEAMHRFDMWMLDLLTEHSSKYQKVNLVAVAYPSGFDFTFVYYYLIKFLGMSRLGFSCVDIKSYAAALLGFPYKDTVKRNMPKKWFKDLPAHTHRAVDDALGQGALFRNMLIMGK